MAFWNRKKETKSEKPAEAKSYLGSNASPLLSLSFIDHLHANGHRDLAAAVAMKYYKQVAPLYTSVNKIIQELCCIPLAIFNEDTKEFDDQHDLIKLLKQPSAVLRTKRAFFADLVSYWLMTGNTYLIATGQVNKPPLELAVAAPSSLSIKLGQDGYPVEFSVNAASTRVDFDRSDDGDIFRYFNGEDRELYQIVNFNPATSNNQRSQGMSPFTPIFYEIEQYISASQHNWSLLERGATVSGMFLSDNPLDEEQFAQLKEEIDTYYTGSHNAGRPLIASGGLDFKTNMQSNRDMDFKSLKSEVTTTIYNASGIPLPLVNPDHMTLSNYDSARMAFYEQTVLPTLDLFLEEIQVMLFPRYTDLRTGNKRLTYQTDEIPALEKRRMERTKDLNDLDVLTDNEIRALIKYEGYDGGDEVYKPLTVVPVGSDAFTMDNLDKPRKQATRKKFIERILEQKDVDGKQLVKRKEAERMAEKYYGSR